MKKKETTDDLRRVGGVAGIKNERDEGEREKMLGGLNVMHSVCFWAFPKLEVRGCPEYNRVPYLAPIKPKSVVTSSGMLSKYS